MFIKNQCATKVFQHPKLNFVYKNTIEDRIQLFFLLRNKKYAMTIGF